MLQKTDGHRDTSWTVGRMDGWMMVRRWLKEADGFTFTCQWRDISANYNSQSTRDNNNSRNVADPQEQQKTHITHVYVHA